MKKSLALMLGLVLVAGAASASNTGFKLNYPTLYAPSPKSGTNFISLPYFYFANGNIAAAVQNSVDLCSDLNDFQAGQPKIANVARYLTAGDTYKVQPCATTKSAFDLIPGEGYAIYPKAANIVVNIVGSHDDAYKPPSNTKTYPLVFVASPKSSLNFVSVPYHSTANNAVDLCQQLNAQTTNKISNIQRYLTAGDTFKVQPCATTKSAFDIIPGEGYGMVPTQNVGIAIPVY